MRPPAIASAAAGGADDVGAQVDPARLEVVAADGRVAGELDRLLGDEALRARRSRPSARRRSAAVARAMIVTPVAAEAVARLHHQILEPAQRRRAVVGVAEVEARHRAQ